MSKQLIKIKKLNACTLVVASAFAAGIIFPLPSLAYGEGLQNNEPYKSIIKIKAFTLDEDYGLSSDSYGSGVLISKDGLALTNNHVIDSLNTFDNTDDPISYQVCLPENTTDEPNCSYIGKLISKNKDLDIALLKIENIPGLSETTEYPFLELNKEDLTNVNDEVSAIGYPDIGESSVTLTKGVVSGKTEKYGKKWIKTDAIISFGSSGGAALDKNNKVIGITSAGHSDLLGSLGYIINISSINKWIEENQTKTPQNSKLIGRLIEFTKKEKVLKTSNTFENVKPGYSINKPKDWEFDNMGDNGLFIENPGDEDGGYVAVILQKFPNLVSLNQAVNSLKTSFLMNNSLSYTEIQSNADIKINNVNGKKLVVASRGKNKKSYYLMNIKDYIIIITYDYGLDEKDKKKIDEIINSLKDLNAGSKEKFYEIKKISNTNPNFSLDVSADWLLAPSREKTEPLTILNKKYSDIYVTIGANKYNEDSKNMTPEEVVKAYKENLVMLNAGYASFNTKFENLEAKPKYKLGKNLGEVIKIVSNVKTSSNNKVIGQITSYHKKINDKYFIDLTMYTTSTDKKTMTNYQKEFEKLLTGLKIAGNDYSKIDSDNDGLADGEELLIGTSPNYQDTDHDGLADGLEIKANKNPLDKNSK